MQTDYGNTSSQHNIIQNEWLHKQRLDVFPCIHNLITTDHTECAIYPNSSDVYNEYDICRDVLYYTSIYVASNFTYVVWNIAALNSVFNPLIYAFMSSDFKIQIKKMKRRMYAHLGYI